MILNNILDLSMLRKIIDRPVSQYNSMGGPLCQVKHLIPVESRGEVPRYHRKPFQGRSMCGMQDVF